MSRRSTVVGAAPSVAAQRQLDALARSQPETGGWLALVAEALREGGRPEWDAVAAGVRLSDGAAPAPLLKGATVPVPPDQIDEWVRRLLRAAGDAGPAAAALGGAADSPRLDAIGLTAAAINEDAAGLAAHAATLDVADDALGAVARLAAMPPLQACRRRFAAAATTAPDWSQGHCPVCGGWPTLAESRGLDRSRHLRCARCGGDWVLPALRCPFCQNADHQHLGSLVPEGGGEARRVETCDRCRGYVKSVATLRAWAGDEVALADLATVDLDLAAVERGFARPDAAAVDLDLRLVGDPGNDASTAR